ncbi:MAG: 5-formyltetrahydrofolate cyclo-ligase [Pontixanthobacter sp.]
MSDKAKLRKQLRAARKKHVAAIPDNIRALLFRQPPTGLANLIPASATIGLYHAAADEAPAGAYARYFAENGHVIALPRFANHTAAMEFAVHSDPFGESDLEQGAFDIMQPHSAMQAVVPEILFVPLLGFTAEGDRIGQGGGHYDRWLGEHPDVLAIGLAWDSQLMETLPLEPHDRSLSAIVTPTRLYGPF